MIPEPAREDVAALRTALDSLLALDVLDVRYLDDDGDGYGGVPFVSVASLRAALAANPSPTAARDVAEAAERLRYWGRQAADLTNDIRVVDGNHDLGAGELAARLVERGWTRATLAASPTTARDDWLTDVPKLNAPDATGQWHQWIKVEDVAAALAVPGDDRTEATE